MNKSQLPTIAKKILKKLNSSESKDILLNVDSRNNKYEVCEYSEESKLKHSVSVSFDYSNNPLPTQQEIEEYLYNYFIKVRSNYILML